MIRCVFCLGTCCICNRSSPSHEYLNVNVNRLKRVLEPAVAGGSVF